MTLSCIAEITTSCTPDLLTCGPLQKVMDSSTPGRNRAPR